MAVGDWTVRREKATIRAELESSMAARFDCVVHCAIGYLFPFYGVKSSEPQPRDPMRGFVLFLTLLFALMAAVIKTFWGDDHQAPGSIAKVAPIGLARLAMVMAALWIAWPAVRKPALWLPPGALVLGLVALGVCVVQPRLAIALVPAASALIAFSAILRYFRGK